MKFKFECIEKLPPLAWIARAEEGMDRCELRHGNRVEIRPDWFCEAVWSGPFEEGDFDSTDIVAGSGGRVRRGNLVFVSSGNTVDRIVWIRAGKTLWVSNSLPLLVAACGARIDISYPKFYEDLGSVTEGLDGYKRTLATDLGDVQIQIFGQVEWNGTTVSSTFKKLTRRALGNFEEYEAFLRSHLEAVAANMAAKGRDTTYEFLATVSAGYDSATVAALASRAGCTKALCIDRDRYGNPEGGEAVANALGLRTAVFPRDAWREGKRNEVYFLAAMGEAEAIPLSAAGEALSGKVLLTGYHGDKVWSKDTIDQTPNIVRGDPSGLSLSEYRLWAGFIHCPPTFWGVRQIADVVRISNSAEMHPWDVPGSYSRPIPRRIVEGAGVARNMFGISKQASAVGITEFLSPAALEDYLRWIEQHRGHWVRRGRLPPVLSSRYEALAEGVKAELFDALRRTPGLWRFAPANHLERPSSLRRHAFAWSIHQLSAPYRAALDLVV